MRRILLIGASVALLLLPAAASSGAVGRTAHGFLVVRNARGVTGRPVVTVVVQGFVVGRISPKTQAQVSIYHLPSEAGPQMSGTDVAQRNVRWRSAVGKEYRGSGFRFAAIGGDYRVVIRGSGVYLFAGGQGHVTLRGSSFEPASDGSFSLNGRRARSLPTLPLKFALGRG